MEDNFILNVLQIIASGAYETSRALSPTATQMMRYLLVLEIMIFGATLSQGLVGAAVTAARIVIVTGMTAGALASWPEIIDGGLDFARGVLATMFGEYQGPRTVFGAALTASGRLAKIQFSFSFASFGDFAGSVMALYAAGLAVPAVFFGLAAAGFLACLAELIYIICATMVPLLLPFLVLRVTAPIAMRAISGMLAAILRIVMLGAYAHLFQEAILGSLERFALPDQPLTHNQVYSVMGAAVFLGLGAIAIWRLAGEMVGEFGSSIVSVYHQVTGAVSSAAGAAARTTASAAGGGGGGAAWSAAGRAAESAASSGGGWGGGSPFKSGGSVGHSSSSFGTSRSGGSPFARRG